MPHFVTMFNFRRLRRGDTLVFVLIFAVVVTILVMIVYSRTSQNIRTTDHRINDQAAIRVAEAGIEKAVWCLNNPANGTDCPNNPVYTGESSVSFGSGKYTTQVVQSGATATVTSTSTLTGSAGTSTRELTVTLTQAASLTPAFQFGVQAGEGGINLSNNATIIGNAYTNGSITGSNGSSITGDAVLAVSSPTLDQASDPSVSPLLTKNIGDLPTTQYLAQSFTSGVNDTIYSIDLKLAKHNTPASTVTLYIYSDNAGTPGSNISGSGQALTVTPPNDSPAGWENGWTNQLFSPNTILLANTKYWLVIKLSANSTTRYWTTVRSTDDTTYANGTAKIGSAIGTLSPLNYDIAFRVNVGGQYPTLSLPSVGGNAYSHIMSGTTIGKKAYYKQLSGTVRANGGSDTCTAGENGPNCFDNSTDQSPQNFPISGAQIAQIEAVAAAAGTTTCSPTCTISTGTSIGPRKYVGNVTINGTVTLTGTIWVQGDLTVTNSSIIQLSSAYGANSGTIVVDDPANPTTNGQITLSNGGDLRGNYASCSGSPLKCSSGSKVGQSCSVSTDCPNGNYIMAISMNSDPTFTTPAINVSNNLNAGVLYAPYGLVSISNNADLSEVTAQKITLANNCQITYQSGLASSIFTSGPGGSWVYQPGSYQIVQ